MISAAIHAHYPPSVMGVILYLNRVSVQSICGLEMLGVFSFQNRILNQILNAAINQ